MASLNRVILVGNLTRDPELRATPNGNSVAKFGLAVNRRYTNKQGERVEDVDFFNIVVWGRQAENCSTYIRKGNPVAIEGRLQSSTWETPEGQKRSKVEIIADNVQFLGAPSRGAEATVSVEELGSEVFNDAEMVDDFGADVPF